MKKILLLAATAMMSAAAFAQPKFAHVDFAEIVQLMPEADQARATMEASQKEAGETLQAMSDEFNSKYQQYQQKGKSGAWTPAIVEAKEKELADLQQRIMEFRESVSSELQQQQQQLMAPIYKKANDTVEKIAKELGYIYVFDKSSVLYIDDSQSDDLTPKAREALGIPADRTLESLQKELQAKAAQQQ